MNYFFYNTYKYILILNIILLFLWGCSDKNTEKNNVDNNQILHFDVTSWEKEKTIPLKILDDIDFIPLETNDECLIGEIIKIVIENDLIYIQDRGYNQSILIFKLSGEYVNQIGSRGKGPGEFLEISDFVVDHNNLELLVLDMRQKKVIKYNLHNGDFKNEIKIDFSAINFVKLSNNKLCFYSNLPHHIKGLDYSITILDENYKLSNNYLPKDIYDTFLNYPHSLYKSESVYFASYFKDTVYKITENGVIPSISFNFGENKIPKNKLSVVKHVRDVVKIRNENELTYGLNNVIENTSFLTFNFYLQRKKNIVIYSKKTGNYYYGERYDGILSHFLNLKNISEYNHKFYSSVDAFLFKQIKNQIIDYNEVGIKNKYLKTYDALTSNANPILIAISYHKF